jgi:hypothetical protein
MRFELRDLTIRNVTRFFPTKAAVPAAVRAAVARRWRAYAEAFALTHEDARGRSKTSAREAELVERALRAADAPASSRPNP